MEESQLQRRKHHFHAETLEKERSHRSRTSLGAEQQTFGAIAVFGYCESSYFLFKLFLTRQSFKKSFDHVKLNNSLQSQQNMYFYSLFNSHLSLFLVIK